MLCLHLQFEAMFDSLVAIVQAFCDVDIGTLPYFGFRNVLIHYRACPKKQPNHPLLQSRSPCFAEIRDEHIYIYIYISTKMFNMSQCRNCDRK